MVKTRIWVAVIALILLLSAGAALWLRGRAPSGRTANVYQDGVCIASFDLDAVTETEQHRVESQGGSNVIEVGPEGIRVLEADCPDQVCVHAGWLTDSAAPIVCLPHKLVIRLEERSAALDGVSR